MYEQFYGLAAKPFSLLPDPAYLYLSPRHEVAMSILEYAVTNDLVLSVVTGEVGSGKTTLVRNLLNQLGDSHTVGLISNTHYDFDNLMQTVAAAFGIPFKDKGKVELHQDFVEFLIEQYRQGRRTLLIVDEAQNLAAETLEEIRLLTNINADEHMLLQLLLVGQPELHELLKRHDLRQLAQRISVIAKLEPLDEKETAAYVRHRLTVAGGDPKLFHKNALRLIYWNSGGIPRVINTLCDLALVYGYADRKKKIDAMLIADIARDRFDTGLYGNRVFDVQNLKDADDARRAAREAATKPADGDVQAAEEAVDRNVFDLVVDGVTGTDAATKKRTSGN
tara:strand:+ start:1708 stop:2715 length:1008 start_codon:yes stop_codon:yes gene_type:complete